MNAYFKQLTASGTLFFLLVNIVLSASQCRYFNQTESANTSGGFLELRDESGKVVKLPLSFCEVFPNDGRKAPTPDTARSPLEAECNYCILNGSYGSFQPVSEYAGKLITYTHEAFPEPYISIFSPLSRGVSTRGPPSIAA